MLLLTVPILYHSCSHEFALRALLGPEEPNFKAKGREQGWFLGRGSEPYLHQLGGSVERCEFPQQGCECPTEDAFWNLDPLTAQKARLWRLTITRADPGFDIGG